MEVKEMKKAISLLLALCMALVLCACGSGNFVDISPLSSKEYILAIPCASALAEDETSPLKVIFTLLVDGVDKEFVYVIR